MAVGPQGAGDDVEDDRPAQAADVDRAGRGLRVVDDLGPASGPAAASSSAQSMVGRRISVMPTIL